MKRKKQVHIEAFQVRAPTELMQCVDEWRATRRPIPSRAEAIRQLLAEALNNVGRRERPRKGEPK